MPHTHTHSHGAGCGHGLSTGSLDRAMAAGVALNTLFVAAEAVAGVTAGSLALLADAGHNAGDVLGLLLAWAASRLATRMAPMVAASLTSPPVPFPGRATFSL